MSGQLVWHSKEYRSQSTACSKLLFVRVESATLNLFRNCMPFNELMLFWTDLKNKSFIFWASEKEASWELQLSDYILLSGQGNRSQIRLIRCVTLCYFLIKGRISFLENKVFSTDVIVGGTQIPDGCGQWSNFSPKSFCGNQVDVEDVVNQAWWAHFELENKVLWWQYDWPEELHEGEPVAVLLCDASTHHVRRGTDQRSVSFKTWQNSQC